MNQLSTFKMVPLLQEIESFSEKMRELTLSLNAINENIVRDNSDNHFEYLQTKQIQTAAQLFNNFLSVTLESMSKQVENGANFKKHYESFFFQSNDFNQTILKEQDRINKLSSEMLKKRSTDSIRAQIDNFYSIYDISMKI